MIRDHEEIQGPYELHLKARIGSHLLATRHPIAVMRGEGRSDEPCVERKVGVKVHVAKKHPVGVRSPCVRRVCRFFSEVVCRDHDLLSRYGDRSEAE